MMRTHRGGQCGQVGLVVLLVGAVLMTIGLGVASQSVMEIGSARLETDSSQAFNAAEQGIEAALKNPADGTLNQTFSGYDVNVTSVPRATSYQGTILAGHSVELNIAGVNSLVLNWTDPGCGAGHAALIVTLINAAGTSISRQAYGRSCGGDNFTGVTCGALCTVTPGGVGGWRYARIKAVYGDTQLSATLTGAVNPQYYEITSTAKKQPSGEARSVQVSKSIASVPSLFDYALFSGADLSQQP